ncbi:hypothetical protein ACLMJK_002180 [Lecanora helva]
MYSCSCRFWTCALLSALFVYDTSFAQPVNPQASSFQVAVHQPQAAQSPSPNTKVDPKNQVALQRRPGSTSSRYTKALAKGNGDETGVEGTYGTTTLKSVESGLVYTTDIEFGTETFTAVIDTGSSDTWLVENNFTCNKGAQSACEFGTPYKRTNTFRPIANENFEISYSDGEFLDGIFGKEKVTLAGVTVNDQQVALVEKGSWEGDGTSSGVLGLGFPANTRAFTGSDYSKDSAANQITYNPIFTSMYKEGSVPPLFSLALERDGTGQLAVGGTPDVQFVPVFASSPFQMVTTSGTTAGKTQYTFYSITTNGFEYQSAQSNWNVGSWLTYFGNPNDPTKVQVLIDSGTTVNYLPQTIADAVNKLFEPAAAYNSPTGYYDVKCDAKVPEFGVKIGQEIFYINSKDMIIHLDSTTCITGVTSTGVGGNSILGHAFLKNVLAVFDVGASEMRFAAREYY